MVSLLVSLAPNVFADNGTTIKVGNEDANLYQIYINFDGYLHTASVMKTQDGSLLVPLEWMTFYGGLKYEELQGVRQYYKPDQKELSNFAKRWIIAPSVGRYYVNWYFDDNTFAKFLLHADDFSFQDAMRLIMTPSDEERKEILDDYFSQKNTKVKRMGTNYMPIYEGEFSKILSYGNDYWVPISELFAMLEVTAAVSPDDRILCVKPSETTLFDVLYKHADGIEDLLFDSDNVIGNDFMAGVGWVVATCSGEIYNVIPVIGREIDYEEIFTSYLQDNEVYLSTFNSQSDSKAAYYNKVAGNFKDAKTVYESLAKSHKPVYDLFLEGVTNPEFYTKYFEPAKKVSKGINIVASAMNYISAFANQVEDHRLMLKAVYDYKAEDKWPSKAAAMIVSATYESLATVAITGTIETTYKLAADELAEEVYKKAFGGWYYAMEITKVLCKDDYEYVVNSSKINLISNTVQYSYEIFEDRLYNRQFNEAGIDKIRLCLMMSLVGSNHAYKTFYTGEAIEKREGEVDAILTKLYQVGENRKENNINICQDRLKQYRKDFADLHLMKSDPVVLAETSILLSDLFVDTWSSGKFTAVDTDSDMHEEVLILTDSSSGLVKTEVDIDADEIEYVNVTVDDIFSSLYHEIDIVPEVQSVFGDPQAQISALDAHFAQRDGLIDAVEQDLNDDGISDRIYVFFDAVNHWSQKGAQQLPAELLTLLTAESDENGITLRIYVDDHYKGGNKHQVLYSDGELLVNGYAYTYLEDYGVPFEKVGLVELQSLYRYLNGEIKPWEQARVEITYPDDSNHYKMDLDIDGIQLYVYAQPKGNDVQYHEIRVEPQGKTVPIIDDITTDHTATQIINALSLVSWDNRESIPASDNLSAVMGPYPLMSNAGVEGYECSVLWVMPDGEIFQLTMKLHEENLDTAPYSLIISSLNKPLVSVHELLLKSKEDVSNLISGYRERYSTTGEDLYVDGQIGDAKVEVHFDLIDNQLVAEGVKVFFKEDTIDVFPGLKSSASAEDAKEFLQPNMDWDLQKSESIGDIDRFYSTSFCYDQNTEAFWYTTMITDYSWNPTGGYSEGAFGGIQLSYSGEKDAPDMAWYWVLYG